MCQYFTRILLSVCLVSLLFLMPVPAHCAVASSHEHKSVLFLSSNHPGFPTFPRQVAGIQSVFDSHHVYLDIEFMDSKRFDLSEILDSFHKAFTYKLSHLPPYDLVLVGDDNALNYVLAHQEDLFKNIPIVFFGVNNRRLALDQDENPLVTGVVESVSIAETLALITQLQPDVRRIVAITAGTATSLGGLDGYYAQAREFKSIQFSHLSLEHLSFDELSEVLKTLDREDAVLLLSAFVDSTGHRVSFAAGLTWVMDNLEAPLYHLWQHGMGEGIIGGKLASHYDQGRLAAEIAAEILEGRPVQDVPVVPESPSRFMVDPEAMEAMGIPLALIPDGAERFIARPSTAITYRVSSDMAKGVVGVFCLLSCVMAVIVFHRRRANEQVAQSELRFRQLTCHMEEVFCVGSMETREIHEISSAVENIIGLTPSTLIRHPVLLMEAVHKGDRERFVAYLGRVHSGQENMESIEFRMRDLKSQVRWIRFRGFGIEDAGSKELKIAGMATDITDAKQEDTAMKALVETLTGRVEQDFFDGAVRQLCSFLDCDMAIISALKDGNMVQTLAMVKDGRMMESMTYHIVGSPCFETMSQGVCIYPEGLRKSFPDNAMLLQMGAEGYLGHALRNRHGEVIGALCALSRKRFSIPKRTQEVVVVLAKGIATEMERMESEREKKEMEISLIRSQKIQAIGTLAGGIAHDFNNILFPIMGYVQLMLEETAPESTHGGYLSRINASTLRAKKLVGQILAFSRKGDQVFESVSVPALITEVMDLVRSSLPSTIDLQVDIAKETLPVMGDATQIHQVVMNLVTNAYHAMEGRVGCLWIQLTPTDKMATDGTKRGTPGLTLSIRDTGCGIAPSLIECIFDPYFTTKPKEKGTGLGLAVVQGIVKNHGGDIGVESTLGAGTTFTVTLPCIERAHRQETASKKVSLPRGHEHILVVDDEEEVAMVEQMMLKRLGYRVSVASNGMEALVFFAAGSDAVHLVLTDMTMPQMTGLQLVARVREMGHSVPVLLCTGLKDPAQERAAEGLGILGIVKKPVSMDELATQVRRALDATR